MLLTYNRMVAWIATYRGIPYAIFDTELYSTVKGKCGWINLLLRSTQITGLIEIVRSLEVITAIEHRTILDRSRDVARKLKGGGGGEGGRTF